MKIRTVSGWILAFVCAGVHADDIPSSGGKLGPGDRVVLSVDIPGFVRVSDPPGTTTKFFAPKGAVMWVDRQPNDAQMISVHFACIPEVGSQTRVWCTKSKQPRTEYAATATATSTGQTVVDTSTQYLIPIASLESYAISSVGSQYGVLLVPYKFHLSDSSFSSGVTLGGYYNYSFSSPGIAWGPVVSAGLSAVPVATQAEDGTPTTENKAAVSAAVGLLLTFSKTSNFQIGILAGWDWLGDDADYEHEGKTWVALSFGVPLTK